MATNKTILNRGISRRRFLILSGVGLAGAGLSACSSLPVQLPAQRNAGASPATTQAAATTVSTPVDLEIALTAQPSMAAVLPGAATPVLSYTGAVLQGDPAALQTLPGSYLGPIIRAQTGQRVRIRFQNQLAEESNIHWHGLIVPQNMDGGPHDLVAAGGEYVYEFEVRNRAGTYWYHPHKHGSTGPQVYQGLAGLFIVSDAEESQLGLPDGEQDIALVLQDRSFQADNQLVYLAGNAMAGNAMAGNAMGGMMDQMMGFLGDRILVNGQANAVLPVATRPYRLRLLNGSNARIYKLAWSDGRPMTVLGTDGGLLAEPLTRPYVALSPGERLEIWADFSDLAEGAELKLQSLTYEGVEAAGAMGGAMGGMMGMMGSQSGSLANGAAFDVLTVRAERREEVTTALPASLTPLAALQTGDAINSAQPRRFVLAMNNAMQWTINGHTFEMNAVAPEEQVKLGTTEVWEFDNTLGAAAELMGQGGGAPMGDFMAHPMHIHGVHFRVVQREVDEAQRAGWDTLQPGYVDEGWKDTVLVMPGERVQVLVSFDNYPGLFVYHCHNLEHSDTGMMRNYRIEE